MRPVSEETSRKSRRIFQRQVPKFRRRPSVEQQASNVGLQARKAGVNKLQVGIRKERNNVQGNIRETPSIRENAGGGHFLRTLLCPQGHFSPQNAFLHGDEQTSDAPITNCYISRTIACTALSLLQFSTSLPSSY